MANAITVSRFPLLFVVVGLLYASSAAAQAVAVPLVILLILLDTIDGVVARARGETSLLGSVLDIMVDRSVELVLWVVYAHLRLVPVVIPIVFIVRGVVVDSLRAVEVSGGKTPFGSMTSRLGRWLVAGPVMRSSYGAVKLISFAGLALTQTLISYAALGRVSQASAGATHIVFLVLSWVATLFCIVRGVPVIVESVGRLKATAQAPAPGQTT
jgi:CDP-diacylglycerol--glycerol-3-phosphate 3-phosphatidyltransferase